MTMTSTHARAIVDLVDRKRLWGHLDAFSTTVRTSGSPAEATAFAYAERVLRDLGFVVRRLDHDGYVSMPGAASLRIGSQDVPCITHAMAAPTKGTQARLAWADGDEVEGRIAVEYGLARPGAVRDLANRGAVGAIFINANQRYEMVVSPVWGSPDAEQLSEVSRIPILSVTGDVESMLSTAIEEGEEASMQAEVETGWCTLPLLEATLTAPQGDGSAILFSGHIDAWHYGAMDNGGANATMLEVATVLATQREAMNRDLKILFWSGHSHGRYAGSQWYADHHAEELRDRVLLHVNIDSVGGAGADDLTQAPSMPETFALAARVIADETGQRYEGVRFERAGDQSFWGHGVSSVFMGLSEQPRSDDVAGRAFGALFGKSRAGGFGWWWHTPEDTIDKLDPERLTRDCRVYLRLVHEACTAPVAPLSYAATARDLAERIERWSLELEDRMDLSTLAARSGELTRLLDRLEASWVSYPTPRAWQTQKALARHLVPLEYVAGPVHAHDPALAQPPVPLLAGLEAVSTCRDEVTLKHLRVGLQRRVNHVAWELREACRVAQAGLDDLEVTR